jgi:hypothetical protein
VRQLAWFGVLVVLLVGLTAGCGGDGEETAVTTETVVTTETTSEVTEASVTSLEVGDLQCFEGQADGTATVVWETDAATAVEITVDGATVLDEGPSGSADVSVPCDGATHDVGVTALSDAGTGQSESQQVGPG